MGFWSQKQTNAIKVEKVDNGFLLSTYVEQKDMGYTYDKKVKELVFANADDLLAKIKEVWGTPVTPTT